MNTTDNIFFFWQHDFSQWSDIGLVDGNGKSYISCGQYMQVQKAKLFDDTEAFNLIRSSDSPQEQQELGRKVKNFDSVVWDQRKLDIVFRGNYLKFLWNDELQQELLATGSKILANASPDDLVWGIGFEANAPEATQPDLWRGQNLLGEILMQVREAFRHHEPIFKAEKRISDLKQRLCPTPQYQSIKDHTASVSNLSSAHSDELERNQLLQAWMQSGVGNDFVKVSQEGKLLAQSATEWSGVYDQNTGLLWQTNCSTSSFYWGGASASTLAYIEDRGEFNREKFRFEKEDCPTYIPVPDFNEGTYYDNWSEWVEKTNQNQLCGYSDWRVPSLFELMSLSSFYSYKLQ